MIEDAKIIFRNFEGKEGPYNRKGDRNFSVLLPDDVAEAMARDGWNIKTLKAREDVEGDQEEPYLTVSVGFRFPPRLVMITSRGRTELDEETCELLDMVDIQTADLRIRPYNWDVNGKQGVKAYLKSIYVTVYEDELDLKYADIPDVPTRSGRVEE
jgi:hypothetical protein